MALLVLVRASGKQSIRQGTTFQFVIALVIGDMIDDVIWAEVSLAKFLVAVVTLFAHALGDRVRQLSTAAQLHGR